MGSYVLGGAVGRSSWSTPSDKLSSLLGAGSWGWGASGPHAPIRQSKTLTTEKDVCWGQQPLQNPPVSPDPHPSPPPFPEDDLRRGRSVGTERVGFQAEGRSRPRWSGRPGSR